MERFCRIIAFFLLVSFVSCTSAPYTINGVLITGGAQSPRLQLLQSGGTQRPSTQPTQQQPRQAQTATPPASPYWTGDGGKGRSITILPPRGSGLAENQAYLPDFVANELVSNFNTFSAMTLFDRVNNQKQYDELLSGYYSDDDKAGMDLGRLASTDYMLLGGITKTSTGYALQLTVNKNSDKTTAASYSGTVSIAELDNLIGVRRASLDLLQKMGVQLTAQARTELTKAPTTDQLNALTAMAQGIIAQRQGTDTSVAALTYFIQAAAFDASLVEAISRTKVLSSNISTGNIGANVRNDFAWFDSWKAKLTETETFMNDTLRNTSPQRSVWYSDNVWEEESARDHVKRTTELRIEAVLHTHAVFPVSVQRTVSAVYDGLQTTGRVQAWKLDGWPRQGVTNVNPFNSRWGSMISIAFEVLNGQGQIIGRQTVEMDSRYSFNGTRLDGPGTSFATVRFTGVKGDDIHYPLSIRIATINGNPPEKAGISRISPISAGTMQANKNYTIYNGAIRPSSNYGNLGNVHLGSGTLWGERVTAVADRAFENRGLTGVIIPDSVIDIGASAFANNKIASITTAGSITAIGNRAFYNAFSKDVTWTIVTLLENCVSIGREAFANNTIATVTIPSSVTSIGTGAFVNNRLTRVTIPEGVTAIGQEAFANNTIATVTIPSSVTSIGQEAFASHWTTNHSGQRSDGSYYSFTIDHWLITEVTIGANVRIGENAFGNGFEKFYDTRVGRAGAYREGTFGWERFDSMEAMKQTVAKRNVIMTTLVVLVTLGVQLVWIIPVATGEWKVE